MRSYTSRATTWRVNVEQKRSDSNELNETIKAMGYLTRIKIPDHSTNVGPALREPDVKARPQVGNDLGLIEDMSADEDAILSGAIRESRTPRYGLFLQRSSDFHSGVLKVTGIQERYKLEVRKCEGVG
ncbi:hypothetical protein NLI96_g8340 [Meripilus lineatus]|uniref:Uncharacterized protein n=1 Tax=Meripilus lineatus TaxID=2056292 RepID=A0AAD5YC34_9APHY|nr:hypothetical protein NLI96_g8340 [Physisporinus lineatus]